MRHRTERRQRPYAAIPNAAMRDESLSIDARGMLALLMTYADEWVFQRTHLMQVAKVGRDKFQKIMRELKEAGYVRRVPTRDDDGKVSGSAWVIADEPDQPVEGETDRQPELPVVGATEGLKNRQPEKPTAGKSGPLRRPNLKKKKRKENAGARDVAPSAFERFWRVFPRVKDRITSERVFLEAVKSGVDPEYIVSAASEYRAEKKGEAGQFLCPSDVWLSEKRWEKQCGETGGATAKEARGNDMVEFWAQKINLGKFVTPSAITCGMAREMLRRELVSEEQLRARGVST